MITLRLGDVGVAADAVVFDLFHTLVDPQAHSAPGFRRLEAVAEILGMELFEIELWWEQNVAEFVASPVSPIDSLVALAAERRIVLSPTAVAELDRAMGGAQDAAIAEPIPGAVETLGHLHRLRVATAILSNAHVRDVRAFPGSPLAGVVDEVCVSCFTGLVKPDGAAYLDALGRLGVEPGRAVFVGDGGGEELRGATEAGLAATICVAGAVKDGGWRAAAEQERIEAEAGLVVASVADLADLID